MLRSYLKEKVTRLDHLLTFELQLDGDCVEIHADSDGLEVFIKELLCLKQRVDNGECEHSHLMTDNWGGDDLSIEMQNKSGEYKLIQHVKLYGWKK